MDQTRPVRLRQRCGRPFAVAQPMLISYGRSSKPIFASLLDARREDPEFLDDPYGRYGGRSLHTRSHGEAFLAILEHRIRAGLFLLDEPESALSPQRQLVVLAHMWSQVSAGKSQFIVVTHSPILLTFPGADLVTFDGGTLARVKLEETSHYQVTRGILHNADSYWKHRRVIDDHPTEPLQPTSRARRRGTQTRRSRSALG